MFDQGGEENYSLGAGYGDYSGADLTYQQGPDIKKYLTLGVAVLVILIIAFLAFNWLGSRQDVTIALSSAGKDVLGVLVITDSSNKPVSTEPKGQASEFKATLWPGDYYLSATSAGYVKSTKKITIPSETTRIDLEMLRDLDATIAVVLDSAEIYSGQNVHGKIEVINNGAPFDASSIRGEVSSNLSTPTLALEGAQTIGKGSSVFIDFNLGAKPTSATAAQKATLSFTVAGSDVKSQTSELQLLPTILETKIGVSGTLKSSSLKAGDSFTTTIKITNNSDFPAKSIAVSVEPASDSEDKLSWIRFGDAPIDNPNTTNIDELNPKQSKEFTLIVTPNNGAQKDDAFNGTLNINSFSIKNLITKDVQYKVSTPRTVSVSFSGTSDFTVNCDSATAFCEEKNLITEVTLQNTGNTEVTNILPQIDYSASGSDAQYCLGWVSLDTNKIASLKPKGTTGDEAPIRMKLTPVYEATPRTIGCTLTWKYVNPITTVTTEQGAQIIKITTKVV